MNSRAYLSSFNFRGTDQQKKVGMLSGGERNRLHLAKMLMSGGNLLLLDEPTNDLDVDTLRALEDALIDFAGCAVVISPRSLVPRSHRDAHPRVRGRQRGRVVRGQLPGLHRGPAQTKGRRCRPAASRRVQEARAGMIGDGGGGGSARAPASRNAAGVADRPVRQSRAGAHVLTSIRTSPKFGPRCATSRRRHRSA